MAKAGSASGAIREYLSSNPDAGPKAIIDALKERGITVKAGLVGSVKHHWKAGARKSARRATAKPASSSPAITGTQAIQAYLKDHPEAGPKEIRTALADQGIKVSASLVSAVKYRKGRKRRTPTVRIAARTTKSTNGSVTVEQLFELKRFVDSFGGAEQVRHGLDVLAQFS